MNAPVPNLDTAQVLSSVTKAWDEDLVGQLSDYIEIPAKSPAFDPNWLKAGYLDTVVQRAATWIEAQKVPGLKLEVLRLPGRTPVMFFEVAATRTSASSSQTILMYGTWISSPNSTVGVQD
jgi:hypothetical protein